MLFHPKSIRSNNYAVVAFDAQSSDYPPLHLECLTVLKLHIQAFVNLIHDKIVAQNRGRRQVVRHQPSKLIFAGPNPVARS